jgi:hypothetical protein
VSCPVCGTPTVPGARFCFACGTALPAGIDTEAERRVVTVLFGDLSDFTSWSEDLDPERVGGLTDRVLATLAAAVTEFGGHVDKLTGDGLMAVFGAPTAHEDDPSGRCGPRPGCSPRCAGWSRRRAAAAGGSACGSGLNTGEVLAGVQAHLTLHRRRRHRETPPSAVRRRGRGRGCWPDATTAPLATMTGDCPGGRCPRCGSRASAKPLARLRAGVAAGRRARAGWGSVDERRSSTRTPSWARSSGPAARGRRPLTPRSGADHRGAGVGETRLAQEVGAVRRRSARRPRALGPCTPYGEER